MFVSTMARWFPILVLAAGLISCNREIAPDVYQATPPTLRNDQGVAVLNEGSPPPTALDLHDRVDFSRAAPRNLKVSTNCRNGGRDSFVTQEFGSQPTFQIFQALPDEILLADLKTNRIYCTFVLDLYNANGSNHLFHFPLVQITDRQSAMLNLRAEPANVDLQKPLQIPSSTSLRLRAEPNLAGDLALLCSTFRSKALPFRQVLDLSLFDYTGLLGTAKEETCRATLLNGKSRAAISPQFHLFFMGPKLQLQTVPEPSTTPVNKWKETDPRIQRIVFENERFRLKKFTLTHTGQGTRYVRLPKAPLEIQTEVALAGFMAVADPKLRVKFLWARFINNPLVALHEDNSEQRATLQPGESLEIETYFQAPPKVWPCGSFRAVGLRFQALEDIHLDELGPNGEVIDHYTLPMDSLAQISSVPLDNMRPNKDVSCAWP